MESAGFMMLYFVRGSLPWMGIKALNIEHKYEYFMNVWEEKEELTTTSSVMKDLFLHPSIYVTCIPNKGLGVKTKTFLPKYTLIHVII